MHNKIKKLSDQLSKVILGKDKQINLALTCLFADGHLLIEDIPGIGKTTLAKSIAKSLSMDFSRVQCTNDMLPGDIIGFSIFDQEKNSFNFHRGPVFTQILLADEINRATPKTQSALLEAMEEKQVSIDSNTFKLEEPFFVIATQNPLEQSGTYPLPESQLDRFLMKVSLGYPERDFEIELLKKGGALNLASDIQSIMTSSEVIEIQNKTKEVHISDSLFKYIQNILEFSRDSGLFQTGLSPRAGINLSKAARAYAYIQERDHVLPEDIQEILPYIACHRLRFKESGQELKTKQLDKIFKEVNLPH
ncbi:UNVERIFIED_CONTAM: hypothetical protein GTU68_020995 [Idotea baltica]|nr:hypothetical protein [Idotea baltica]